MVLATPEADAVGRQVMVLEPGMRSARVLYTTERYTNSRVAWAPGGADLAVATGRSVGDGRVAIDAISMDGKLRPLVVSDGFVQIAW